MDKLVFDRKHSCDWCGCEEIVAVTQYGTTHYNRLICVECCMSINQQQKIAFGYIPFDLNNSIIRFDLVRQQEEMKKQLEEEFGSEE